MSDATDVTESPNTSEPTNTPEPNVFNPHDPDLNIIRRCRSLTVRGVQCRQAALRGQDFCIQHFDRNTPTLGRPGSIAVPLLEDHSAVQLMLTRILHGLLNRQLEPLIATKAIACCRVAALTFPRPAAVARLRPATHPETAEAVPIISTDGAGNLIGPRVLYEGTTDWGVAPTSELGCDRSFMPSHEPRSKCLDDPRYLADPNASIFDSADEPRRVWDPAEVDALYREATDAIERDREAGKIRLKAWEERLRMRELYDRETEMLESLPNPFNPSPRTSSAPGAKSGDDPSGLNLQACAEPVHAADCRPQAAGCLTVVKSVNTATNLIPNARKSVTPKNHTKQPRHRNTTYRSKTKRSSSTPLPLLSFDEQRARYYASTTGQ